MNEQSHWGGLVSRERREEFMNTISHGFGLLLSIAGLVLLIQKGQEGSKPEYGISLLVFGLSLILVYGSSTLYHYVRNPKLKHWCKVLDHVAIYILIAGTYTPFTLITLGDRFGWSMFALVWSLALVGTFFKLFFAGRFRIISTLTYLIMGWLSLLVVGPLLESMSFNGIFLLAMGGAVYSFGTLFYLWRSFPYSHAIWHLFVIGGSVFHYLAIFHHVLPKIA